MRSLLRDWTRMHAFERAIRRAGSAHPLGRRAGRRAMRSSGRMAGVAWLRRDDSSHLRSSGRSSSMRRHAASAPVEPCSKPWKPWHAVSRLLQGAWSRRKYWNPTPRRPSTPASDLRLSPWNARAYPALLRAHRPLGVGDHEVGGRRETPLRSRGSRVRIGDPPSPPLAILASTALV